MAYTKDVQEIATLNQQELFNQFAEGEVNPNSGSTLKVTDLFMGAGEISTFNEVMAEALEELRNDPDPTLGLETLRDTAQGIVNDLTIAMNGFERLKSRRLLPSDANKLPENQRYFAADRGQ